GGRLRKRRRQGVGVANPSSQLVVVVLLFPFSERNGGLFLFISRLFRPLAIGQTRLDDKGIASIDRRRSSHSRVEVALDLLVQPMKDRFFTDGRDAVTWRRHDFSGLD